MWHVFIKLPSTVDTGGGHFQSFLSKLLFIFVCVGFKNILDHVAARVQVHLIQHQKTLDLSVSASASVGVRLANSRRKTEIWVSLGFIKSFVGRPFF